MAGKIRPAIKHAMDKVALFDYTVRTTRRHYVYRTVKYKTWLNCGRYYDAPISPYTLIYIDPTKVREWDDTQTDRYICEVKAGDWDLHTKKLEDYDLYTSILNHFNKGVSWEETEFYKRVISNIESTDNWSKWGCEGRSDFENRLESIDKMFEIIKQKGYKKQRDLERNYDSDPLYPNRRALPPELYEITVNIGRDGKFIMHEGRHRLSVAHALELSSIPVRVLIRHDEWQKRRDKLANGVQLEEQDYRDHPDIKNLLN